MLKILWADYENSMIVASSEDTVQNPKLSVFYLRLFLVPLTAFYPLPVGPNVLGTTGGTVGMH